MEERYFEVVGLFIVFGDIRWKRCLILALQYIRPTANGQGVMRGLGCLVGRSWFMSAEASACQ